MSSTLAETTPSIAAVKALDGRVYERLSSAELAVLNFFMHRGRKYDVAVSILVEGGPDARVLDSSQAQSSQVIERTTSRVSVKIGAQAIAAWLERISTIYTVWSQGTVSKPEFELAIDGEEVKLTDPAAPGAEHDRERVVELARAEVARRHGDETAAMAQFELKLGRNW